MSPKKGKTNENCGRKSDQKMKPFLVYQYLLKNTDENNFKTADDIIEHLENKFEISAERRGIYRDIAEINKAILAVSEGIPLQEAEERIFEDEEEKVIKYDKSKKGFYVSRRNFDFYDLRLLAECVYSAKFLDKKRAECLMDSICDLASEEQAKRIRHDVTLVDRTRTNNKEILNSISVLSDAISKELDGQPHEPEKVSFEYLHYDIDDIMSQAPRRKNKKVTVSPYYLVIEGGNYYLVGFDGKKARNYRVDRMRRVSLSGEPRDGAEQFNGVDMKEYLRQTFGMYDGKKERITIRFIAPLLDTMIDKFGNDRNVTYVKQHLDGKDYLTVSTYVKISPQFYGWLFGLGSKAVITSPPSAVEEFKKHVNKIITKYE